MESLKASIIFPNSFNVAKCRRLAILCLFAYLMPLCYIQKAPLSLAAFKMTGGLFTIYAGSFLVGFFMNSISVKLYHRLAELVERQAHEPFFVTVAPLNRLQKIQKQLIGASSRFAYDHNRKRYRVVYTKDLDTSFNARLYCLFSLGPFGLYTVVPAENHFASCA